MQMCQSFSPTLFGRAFEDEAAFRALRSDQRVLDHLRLHEMENFGEYKKASEETENPAIRAMFKFLADEERHHIKLIRDKMAEFKVKE